ncbi:phosphatidylinositol-4- kinase [Geranomyces variabilis]|nr:phosphatidylinositol-4- kinase [Geranomyces variabilis]
MYKVLISAASVFCRLDTEFDAIDLLCEAAQGGSQDDALQSVLSISKPGHPADNVDSRKHAAAKHAFLVDSVKAALPCSFRPEDLEADLFEKVSQALFSDATRFSSEVVIACLEYLRNISETSEDLRKRSVETYSRFLQYPPPAYVQRVVDDPNARASVRQCASILLYEQLEVLKSSELNRAIINKKVDIVRGTAGVEMPQTNGVVDGSHCRRLAQENCVVALSVLVRLVPSEEVSKVLTVAFESSLSNSRFLAHGVVWEALSNVGLSSGPEIFQLVLSISLNRPGREGAQVRHAMARGAANSGQFAVVYLRHILNSFVDAVTKLGRLSAEGRAELLNMVSIAKTICAGPHIALNDPNIQQMANLFRDFWLGATTSVLEPNGAWPAGWADVLSYIALKTPAFSLSPKARFLDDDLIANSMLKRTFPDDVQARVRSCLSHAFPDHSSVVRSLPFVKCAYLVTVRELETMRATKLEPNLQLTYLRNDRLYNDEVYDFLHLIGTEVEIKFIRECARNREEHAKAIEAHAIQLLFMGASRLPRARAFAASALYRIHREFPFMLWNRRAVHLMLDLLQCLDANAQGSVERKDLLRGKIGGDLNFLDDSDADAASTNYFDMSLQWIASAIKRSSSETMGILQGYMVDLHTNFPELTLGERSDLMTMLGRLCSSQDIACMLLRSVGKHALYYGEVRGMLSGANAVGRDRKLFHDRIARELCKDLRNIINLPRNAVFPVKLHPVLHRAAAMVLLMDKGDDELLELICWTPITVFTPAVMDMAISVWNWLMSARTDLAPRIMGHLVAVWETTAQDRKGLYHASSRSSNPFYAKMTYTPSKPLDKSFHALEAHAIHLNWIRFLLERFKSARVQSEDLVRFYVKLYHIAHENATAISRQWFNREAYYLLLTLGAQIADHLTQNADPTAYILWSNVIDDAFQWFAAPPMFGKVSQTELDIIMNFYSVVKTFRSGGNNPVILDSPRARFARIAWCAPSPAGRVNLSNARQLLLLLLENEIHRLAAWLNPLDDKKARVPDLPLNAERTSSWLQTLRHAWSINPHVAIQLGSRFSNVEVIRPALDALVHSSPASVLDLPEALPYILVNAEKQTLDPQLRYLLHWTAVPPITAVALLGQQYKMHPWILQYAVRVLEHFPVEHVFFYVPQMVQSLRYDTVGYIEHFILSAAKTSQLFAHQIVWNMNANMYKFDKEGQADAPDSLKPTLERVQSKIIAGLSGSAKKFYEREFKFFTEVTGISGKLRPLVESGGSKAEKKAKIDEEMAKIEVEVGVYLPTNPEGIVIDIDKKSGRPLQSHAKAPFMATFQVVNVDEDDQSSISMGPGDVSPAAPPQPQPAAPSGAPVDAAGKVAGRAASTRWMSSIFKVGDDCRQDLLALQLISIFKSIFAHAGLDLYLFPYRVVATAPGCGVIEVIPDSTSRDMMGREQVNSLYGWFVANFGKEDSVRFRKAQHEFIKSLAAYSVIMFLLQIKDRHNGNIMFDNSGHLVHIDFGFMLSIAPGGGLLEVAPFKLTHEMVQVLGDDVNSPQYRQFSELVVKAYLACRPHAEQIVQMVTLMMDSGLPCFKGEVTTRKLRERFLPDKTDRQAAEFMVSCIKHSHENTRSNLYDKFQYMQNGIPY